MPNNFSRACFVSGSERKIANMSILLYFISEMKWCIILIYSPGLKYSITFISKLMFISNTHNLRKRNKKPGRPWNSRTLKQVYKNKLIKKIKN